MLCVGKYALFLRFCFIFWRVNAENLPVSCVYRIPVYVYPQHLMLHRTISTCAQTLIHKEL